MFKCVPLRSYLWLYAQLLFAILSTSNLTGFQEYLIVRYRYGQPSYYLIQ
jgi:hypothetical protein